MPGSVTVRARFARGLTRARRRIVAISRSEVSLILYLTLGLSTLGALAFWIVEPRHGLFRSLWWALVTMTTVGYGDISPQTNEGRVVAIVLMFGGVSILGLISATIASYMVERRLKEGKGLGQVKIKDHIVVAGWATQGEVVLHNLHASATGEPQEVVLINELGEEQIEALAGKYKNLELRYVHGDPIHDFVLERANLRRASVAIVLAGRFGDATTDDAVDNRSLKIVMAMRSANPDLKIFVEVRSVQNEQHIRRAGADDIVSPHAMGANVLANAPLSPGLPLMLKELLAFEGNGFRTVDVPSRFVGRTIRELHQHFRSQHAILVSLVSESRSMGLEDLLQDSGGDFIDAFIANQFSEIGQDMERHRFHLRVNPGDEELVKEGERATVIVRQTEGSE